MISIHFMDWLHLTALWQSRFFVLEHCENTRHLTSRHGSVPAVSQTSARAPLWRCGTKLPSESETVSQANVIIPFTSSELKSSLHDGSARSRRGERVVGGPLNHPASSSLFIGTISLKSALPIASSYLKPGRVSTHTASHSLTSQHHCAYSFITEQGGISPGLPGINTTGNFVNMYEHLQWGNFTIIYVTLTYQPALLFQLLSFFFPPPALSKVLFQSAPLPNEAALKAPCHQAGKWTERKSTGLAFQPRIISVHLQPPLTFSVLTWQYFWFIFSLLSSWQIFSQSYFTQSR